MGNFYFGDSNLGIWEIGKIQNAQIPEWFSEDSFIRQLSENVNKLANLFRSKGLGKNDVIAIYMPVTPTAVATMLACSRIGAVHSVVFAGFSSQALASRIQVNIE